MEALAEWAVLIEPVANKSVIDTMLAAVIVVSLTAVAKNADEPTMTELAE